MTVTTNALSKITTNPMASAVETSAEIRQPNPRKVPRRGAPLEILACLVVRELGRIGAFMPRIAGASVTYKALDDQAGHLCRE